MATDRIDESKSFEMRFASLTGGGGALAFPCDREGHVDMDHLNARARNNYFFARAMVGRQFAPPAVRLMMAM